MSTITAPAPTFTADDLAFLGSLQMAGGANWKAPAAKSTTCLRYYNEVLPTEACPCGCVWIAL